METIKKIFPYSFKEKNGIGGLLINILVQILICAVAGILIGVLALVPVVGIIVGLVGGLVGVYEIVGIVLAILDYLKVLK